MDACWSVQTVHLNGGLNVVWVFIQDAPRRSMDACWSVQTVYLNGRLNVVWVSIQDAPRAAWMHAGQYKLYT